MKDIIVHDDTMFRAPIFRVQIQPWHETKKKILDLIDKDNYHVDSYNNGYLTDFDDRLDKNGWFVKQSNSYSAPVYEILYPWINAIVTGGIGLEMPDEAPHMWSQIYKSGQQHPIHNHGNRGYSFILYLKFDEDKHLATKFYGPFENFFTGGMLHYVPEVEEGDMIAFPSIIKHTSQTQTTDKERMILSFNMFPDGP
jgi:hypothetical protein